jgi:DNA processing protein
VPLSPGALEPLLRLASLPGIGPARLGALIAAFGSAERVLGATAAELSRVPGVGRETLRRLATASSPEARERARRGLAALERLGAVALTPADLAYPESFRQLGDAPFLLFASGDLALLEAPGVALVGTRQPTEYGRATAASLAAELGRAGYTIVSGMARGIDTAAHEAALDAGAGTIGVLGNGIDVVYPGESRRLFARMRAQGLLLSEFVPGEQPLAGNFPRRNRLIAALSRGVVVVEMGTKSGAQHTVTFALEQGREVFAVPGPIGSEVSAGTNQLIKEGARVVTSAADVLEELEGVGHTAPRPTVRAQPAESRPVTSPPLPAGRPADLAPDEAAIYDALAASGERHLDELTTSVGLAAPALFTALLGLELRGAIESLPGKRFRISGSG